MLGKGQVSPPPRPTNVRLPGHGTQTCELKMVWQEGLPRRLPRVDFQGKPLDDSPLGQEESVFLCGSVLSVLVERLNAKSSLRPIPDFDILE